jgi:hypothetical protein
MARGSSGGAAAASEFKSQEMLQSGGQVDNSGKYTVTRKYYVTNESDLLSTPGSISVGGAAMFPTALSFQKISGGVWEKTIEFTAGVGASQTGVVSKLSETSKQEGRVQLETSAEQVRIEDHPEIDSLIKKYNGEVKDNVVVFPPTFSGQGTGTSGGGEKPNPMFGVRYFSKPAATLRHTYAVNSMPGNLFQKVFKIIETSKLPGNFPDLADYANRAGVNLKYYWQIQIPQVSINGGLFEITDTYSLKGPFTAEAAADLNAIA